MPDDKESTKNLQPRNAPVFQKSDEFIPPTQSANVLFKFMNKLEYLKEILEDEAIKPRYNEEKIDYLGIQGIDKMAFPMICFCDIHLNKLDDHMRKYGHYGIGLNKEWGTEQGLQPIQYINPYSNLRKDISSIFKSVFQMDGIERKRYSDYHDFLLHDLFYMKPINGEMFVEKDYKKRNFHDEKEWRFIPDFNQVDTELPMVINQEQMNPVSYKSYSTGITRKPELWFKVKPEKIKYILVKSSLDRTELVDFIIEKLHYDDQIRYELVSKILVYDELEGDW